MWGRGSWRPALRIARRDARRHWLATTLAAVLVALPVAAAVGVLMMQSSADWHGENGSHQRMGGADASVVVSRAAAVDVSYVDEGTGLRVRPIGGRDAPTRDPHDVDLSTVLPAGSEVHPEPGWRGLSLANGGRVTVRTVTLDEPVGTGLAELVGGTAPSAPDEIAVPPEMAAALDILDDDGRLHPDSRLETRDDGDLSVVGLVDDLDPWMSWTVVSPSTRLYDAQRTTRWLADLPDLSPDQMRDLRDSAAADGVGVLFRDAADHPEDWPELAGAVAAEPADARELAIGATVVGVGLVEVVLLVGAALAVGARRQVRVLGLVGSSGGAPRDLRRVVLARGLLVGVVGSLLGGGLGLLASVLARPRADDLAAVPLLGDLFRVPLIVLDVPWPELVAVLLLGVGTGLAAAAYPAWVVGRLSPVDALAERFPAGRRQPRLRPAALWLTGAGLVGACASGWWTSVVFAEDPDGSGGESMLPVAAVGLCLLLALAGLSWLAPYVVARVGSVSRRLWLTGRLAVRDATRHRQRTAAAAIGLMVAVAGALLAGFGASAAVAADEAQQPWLPPGTGHLYANVDNDAELRRLEQTVAEAVDAERVVRLRTAVVAEGGDRRRLHVPGVRFFGGGRVQVVDEDFLVLAGVDEAALSAYRAGEAVVADSVSVEDGSVGLEAGRGPDAEEWSVAAHPVSLPWQTSNFVTGAVWLSPGAAAESGLELGRDTLLAYERGGFEPGDDELLALWGIQTDGSLSSEPQGYGSLTLLVTVGTLLVTAVACGVVVALAAAEGRDDAATLAAVGAPPGRRRLMGAAHGAFVGVVGGGLGLLVGVVSGVTLPQVAGTPGTPVPWSVLLVTTVSVPLLAAGVGWVVTPSRVTLVRREA